MNIRIEYSNSVGAAGQKAAARNAKGKWMFTTIGWGFTWEGSYKQACFLARKSYAQLYETSYGTITLSGYKPVETNQLELDL